MRKRPAKNRIVSLRLTDAEYDAMAAAAAREGRTLTDHIRLKTLDLDRTFFRWGTEPAPQTAAAVPTMMVWHDGSAGRTWPASNTYAAA